jgi:hypothetical protein
LAFTAADLASLARPELVALVHALLIEAGLKPVQKRRNEFAQFDVYLPGPLGTRAKWLIRLYYNGPTAEHLQDVTNLLDAGSAHGMVCLSVATGDLPDPNDSRVAMARADELLGLLRDSSFVSWAAGRPRISPEDIDFSASWDSLLDAVSNPALRWLVPLSRNRKPHALGIPTDAHRLFERVTFKVFTEVLGLSGESWGEQTLFMSKPDGWIRWNRGAALYDCKASGEGYRMSADDWRRFVAYADEEKEALGDQGISLKSVVVISSRFAGSAARHPFNARAHTLKKKTNLDLVYLKATDLARFGRDLDRSSISPSSRRRIRWNRLLREMSFGEEYPTEVARLERLQEKG